MTASLRDLAVRYGLLAWLVCWLAKGGALSVFLVGEAWQVGIESDAILSARWLSLAAYLVPVPFVIAGVALGGRWATAAAASAGALCAALLLLHVSTFGDASFVTALWAGVWLLWASVISEAEAARWGPRLAQAVISLIFLGGALGKLTPEYIDGTVIYETAFIGNGSFLYQWMRAELTPDQLRAVATGFSRIVIASELALATSVLWPSRVALVAAAGMGIAMSATTTFAVFPATGPVTVLGISGLILTGFPRELWDRVAAVRAQSEQGKVVARRVVRA